MTTSPIPAILHVLDRERAALLETVARVPVTARERSPADGRWSIAQVLEHLGIVERRVTGLLAARVAQARSGDVPDTVAARAPFDLNMVRDRSRPFRAMESGEPRGGLSVDAGLAVLEQSRAELRAVLRQGEGLPLERYLHSHPIFGPLDFYEWAEFIAHHEARHAGQIREIAEQLAAPA